MPRFEHATALFGILLLIPALLFLTVRINKIVRTLSFISASKKTNSTIRHLQRSLTVKCTLRALAWISLMLALSGISWGSRLVPIQKNGDAVCFVFDISYSMNANDGNSAHASRLDTARLYADALLQRLHGESVAVVLAKGDGVVALPLTEDYASLTTLLESLSPHLMSATGSSIGKGIKAAISAFPQANAQSSHIWVFTDGDETDGTLASALDDSVRFGIPVTFIGFGSTSGADVLAGDGKTTVHTTLQEEKLKEACAEANKKYAASRRSATLMRYENALAKGAALRLLSEIGNENAIYAYEVQSVSRKPLFILLALLFFILSFAASEFDSTHVRRFFAVSACVFPLMLTSCTKKNAQNLQILESTWKWHQKQYNQATAGFLRTQESAYTTGHKTAELYAAYGLAATYIMQEEYDAALAKLETIDVLSSDCTNELKSAVYYNRGIIAHQNGEYEHAISLFKQAILADTSNIAARINLEMTDFQRSVSRAKSAETEMQAVSESKDDSTLEQGIFNLIKEQEQEQWKRLQSQHKDSDTVDY